VGEGETQADGQNRLPGEGAGKMGDKTGRAGEARRVGEDKKSRGKAFDPTNESDRVSSHEKKKHEMTAAENPKSESVKKAGWRRRVTGKDFPLGVWSGESLEKKV